MLSDFRGFIAISQQAVLRMTVHQDLDRDITVEHFVIRYSQK